MDIDQLKTFVAVAHARSITRASATLHLSQPAVSAHIKAIEDALGLALFQRTSRGMTLTREGERLLVKAEETLAALQALVGEASRMKGQLGGRLRLGAGSNSNRAFVGRLVARFAEEHPEVEVVLEHATSVEIIAALESGRLDAGLYNEPGDPDPALATVEVSRFTVALVAKPGIVEAPRDDWSALASVPWIYPTASACCGRAAEALFRAHAFRPKRIISVDREELTRTLVESGVGVGLLHSDALGASDEGLERLGEAPGSVRVMFAHLASRRDDPALIALRHHATSAAVTSAAR